VDIDWTAIAGAICAAIAYIVGKGRGRAAAGAELGAKIRGIEPNPDPPTDPEP
jgi:hypothetical protein